MKHFSLFSKLANIARRLGPERILSGAIVISVAVVGFAPQAEAIVQYGTSASLNVGDITSSLILDGTIVNADISSSAAITATKIATTTSALFVDGGTQTFAGVKTFSSIPATSGGNCASGNDLCNKTYVDSVGSPNTLTFTTGEKMAAGDSVFLQDKSATSSVTSASTCAS